KGRERTRKAGTGRHYVNVLASVLQYARDLELVSGPCPVEEFRKQLKRRSRTKGGRAAAAEDKIRPVEHPEEIARLVEAAREEGLAAHVHVLLLLDAGLRLGEALGLRWGAVAFGSHAADPRRHLAIGESRPRGMDAEAPKSGRARAVALSARLRDAL